MRSGATRHRSPFAWTVRLALATVAGTIGYAAVLQAFAAVDLHAGDSRQAYLLAPRDGRIMAALSRDLFADGAEGADRDRARTLARAALQREPTAIAAVTTLGLDASTRGQTAEARRLLAYAQSLSRRDFQTQIWALEDAVAQGNVPAALHAYDVALRTSKRAGDLLFPVLGSAISDPAIRRSLVQTLAREPNWRHAFVEYVGESGDDPVATAQLYRELRARHIAVSDQAQAAVIGKLIGKGSYEDAWSFYASTAPGADRRRSRDPSFTALPKVPSPFDWTLLGGDGVNASFQQGDRGGIFDFSLPGGVGAPLLQQVQVLPPGQYVLRGRSATVDQPAASLPYWTLSCLNGREIGRVPVTNSAQQGGRFEGSFTVTADCPVQILTLTAQPSYAPTGAVGQIEAALLQPAEK